MEAKDRPRLHGRDHKRGAADSFALGVDSSENVGLDYGVNSVDPVDGNEDEGLVLTATGDGGSTWAPVEVGSGGPGLEDTILAYGVDAFWKEDESTGTIAHDSSGNGHHLDSGSDTPGWGAAAAPPGTPTPTYAAGDAFGVSTLLAHYAPNLSGDFSAAGWMFSPGPPSTGADNLIGQGNGSTNGWLISFEGQFFDSGWRARLDVGAAAGGHFIEGANALPRSTWYHYGVTRSGSLWTLYVNGLAQPSTFSGAYTPIASNILLGGFANGGSECWVTLFDRALTGGEMLSLYTLAFTLGNAPAGEVPTADGLGGTTFAYPTFEITVDGA